MRRFWKTVTEPLLEATSPKVLVEIGSDGGLQTRELLGYCRQNAATLHVIDPLPKYDVDEWQQEWGPALVFHRGTSHDVLPGLPACDVALVDGDHNWYTVFHELRLLHEISQRAGVPFPVVLLHDVGWPYGRRDLYYEPDRIPELDRQPFARRGVHPDHPLLVDAGGLNGHLHHAAVEGGERNGVLTAVEDFLAGTQCDIRFRVVRGLHGLAVLLPEERLRTSPALAAFAERLDSRETREAIIETIESERIRVEIGRQRERQRREQMAADSKEIAVRDTDMRRILRQLADELASRREDERELRAALAAANEKLQRQKRELEEYIDRHRLAARALRKVRREKSEYSKAYERRKGKERRLEQQLRAIYESRSWLLIGKLRGLRNRVQGLFRPLSVAPASTSTSTSTSTATAPGPRVAPESIAGARSVDELTVDVVVCVHNALEDVTACLESLVRNTRRQYTLYIVDDGSDMETAEYLRGFATRHESQLLRSDRATGYTRAANRGLRASEADWVVLLNSDVVVPFGWLDRMVEAGASSGKLGVVGPLSNAASYQSVPKRFDEAGDWAVNELPEGLGVNGMDDVVKRASARARPRMPFLNGFCFMIRRELLDRIGLLDEESFPRGYGEENDYCLRARAEGFELAVVDDVFVFHAKSKSYSHERRRELASSSRQAFDEKHGAEVIKQASEFMRHNPEMAKVRARIQEALGRIDRAAPIAGAGVDPDPEAMSVLFILPVSRGGGGVHSIVQEALGMRALGAAARIAVPKQHRHWFLDNYPSVPADLFVGFQGIDELARLARQATHAVATIFTSVKLLEQLSRSFPDLGLGYYVQDYEPRIVAHDPNLEREARLSYSRVPRSQLFAKTDWIRAKVFEEHGVPVAKVTPSIDHSVYNPRGREPATGAVRVAAMLRPSTPRRNAEGTLEVLRAIAREYPSGVEVLTFGLPVDDPIYEAATDGTFERCGVMTREGVAGLLQRSDVFVDLSHYQAFGRTGLEAMACGCAVIVPKAGGASEYAIDGDTALVVDTADRSACLSALQRLVEDGDLRKLLAARGQRIAARFTIEAAAASELRVLGQQSRAAGRASA